jgi:hypothetical protein
LLELLNSPQIGVRVQACGAIYSACINDLEMQEEFGVKHRAVVRILEMMNNESYRNSLLDKLTGLIALGSLIRKCPRTQEIFLELHRARPPIQDISASVQLLFSYLDKKFEQELTKLPSILEAIYNMNVDHVAGRLILGNNRTNLIPFLLKVLFSNSILNPTKVLAADALRVTVHRNAIAQGQISSTDIRKLYEMLRSSSDDLQFALGGVFASMSLLSDQNAAPDSAASVKALMQIPEAPELILKVAYEHCRASVV